MNERSRTILSTLRHGSKEERVAMIADAPSSLIGHFAAALLAAEDREFQVAALALVIREYHDPEFAADFAEAAYVFGREVYEREGHGSRVVLDHVSTIASEGLRALYRSRRYLDCVVFADEILPYLDSRGELANLADIYIAKIEALISLDRIDEALHSLLDARQLAGDQPLPLGSGGSGSQRRSADLAALEETIERLRTMRALKEVLVTEPRRGIEIVAGSAPPPVLIPPAQPQATPASEESVVPRSFYAEVRSPGDVVMAKKFTMTVGTTNEPPTPDAPPFVVPATASEEYTITLTFHATGFKVEGDTTRELPVTRRRPYPTTDVRMMADVIEEEKVARTVTVLYSINGETIGSVDREICVHAEEDDETRAAQMGVWRRIFSAPADGVAADLTVIVIDDGSGKLSWSFITPHAGVTTPRKPVHTRIGGATKGFAALLVNQMEAREGKDGLLEYVRGIGEEIRRAMPPAFEQILRDVASRTANRTPSLLLISNEPYVPWELATLDDPLDASSPPFLGVQTCMGRWIVGDRLPPPHALALRNAAVISGTYRSSKWGNLVNALEEAKSIRDKYGAIDVEASTQKILDALKMTPACDLLHFSMHGQCDDESIQNGLITIDGNAIAPPMITGSLGSRSGTPFVFLNACQVAGGMRILGDYSGLAAEFVKGGAAGVVAPLWKIDDKLAKQIALEFYDAIDRGDVPAEVIRTARLKITASKSGNYLAYQFFGHPALLLDTTQLRAGGH